MKLATFIIVLILATLGTAQEQQPATVECGKSEIKIKFTQQFFLSLNIDVSDPTAIHFKNHRECPAEPEDDGYSLTLKPPYSDCGVFQETKEDVHVFSNEILHSTENSKILIFKFSCEYKRKYLVSSDLTLTPVVRTLSFATERGTFDVSMNLFQREDYNPKSMYGPRPVILIGVPVYAAVAMVDTFQMSEIVNTIEACYATDDKDHTVQKLTHTLITNKCVSSEDETVRIISNGESMISKFKFNMFRWNSDVEYFYLHCEVKVCNRTNDQCVGQGPVCNGEDPSEGDVSRKRREIEEEEIDVNVVKGTTGILSLGPIAMSTKEVVDYEQGGLSFIEEVFPEINEVEKDQSFLQVYIYIVIAAVFVIVGLVAVTITIIKRKNQKRRQALKEGSVSSNSVQISDIAP